MKSCALPTRKEGYCQPISHGHEKTPSPLLRTERHSLLMTGFWQRLLTSETARLDCHFCETSGVFVSFLLTCFTSLFDQTHLLLSFETLLLADQTLGDVLEHSALEKYGFLLY